MWSPLWTGRVAMFAACLRCATGFVPNFLRPSGSVSCFHRHLPLSISSWPRYCQPQLRMQSSNTINLGQDLGEMFDIYKEPDASFFTAKGGSNPIISGKSLPRKQVHASGAWHRAVHIWVYNSKGEVILQKRYLSNYSTRFRCVYIIAISRIN